MPRVPKIRDTPAIRAAFTALWTANPQITRGRIGERLGVSSRVVSAYAERIGLPSRPPGSWHRRDTLLDGPGAEDLFARMWLGGVANAEIVRALGKRNHPSNVSQAAHIRGLPKRPRNFRGLTIEEWQLRELMMRDAEVARERAAA